MLLLNFPNPQARHHVSLKVSLEEEEPLPSPSILPHYSASLSTTLQKIDILNATISSNTLLNKSSKSEKQELDKLCRLLVLSFEIRLGHKWTDIERRAVDVIWEFVVGEERDDDLFVAVFGDGSGPEGLERLERMGWVVKGWISEGYINADELMLRLW